MNVTCALPADRQDAKGAKTPRRVGLPLRAMTHNQNLLAALAALAAMAICR
jgi:hypothetical protein